MKTILLFLAVVAVGLAGPHTADAHAIWLETSAQAAKNKAHEVKIFYGEYPEGELEPTAKWYSDLKTLDVWVSGPGQQRTKLTLTDATTHLVGSFTPSQDGVYYLTTTHTTKDLGGTTKYAFSSVAPVLVGKAAVVAAPAAALFVLVQPKAYKANDPVEVQVWKDGKAFQEGKVELMSPEGWVKTMKTDVNGKVTFTPRLKGSYVLEASDYQPEAGEWNQQKYTHSWHGSTTRILIN
ncbi:DUF4198 domain-containing protein [Hymenobacter metallicola]|uniref:DUF4198 domain-containing protein n=1 Tax=Hymenobacter metallicola TaxID=2563114 RepID=A0A4Z0PTH1_9BACT|nr:DUF4198 domain-containing protein [Hymenobacter metallicola]TGE21018.1 DUF4198 domain-containing protein [Hymenobacter metallicola]